MPQFSKKEQGVGSKYCSPELDVRYSENGLLLKPQK
jgi:hypothetical protein